MKVVQPLLRMLFLDVMRIINEPTAAAIAYNLTSKKGDAERKAKSQTKTVKSGWVEVTEKRGKHTQKDRMVGKKQLSKPKRQR